MSYAMKIFIRFSVFTLNCHEKLASQGRFQRATKISGLIDSQG
jgi:hypothetical protein